MKHSIRCVLSGHGVARETNVTLLLFSSVDCVDTESCRYSLERQSTAGRVLLLVLLDM